MRPLQQQLGDELRRLRKARNLKQVEVAHEVGMSDPTLSRLERGATQRPDLHDVLKLLDLYRASKAERARITELAQRSSDRNARKTSGSRQGTSAELESAAREAHEYQPGIVPALLQTPAYAKVRAKALRSLLPEVDETAETEALLRRQQVLSRKRSPLRYHVLIDEAVLRRNQASVSVMTHQFRHLVEIAARPNVDVRVIPLQAKAESLPTRSEEHTLNSSH